LGIGRAIYGYTQVLTTAISQATQEGDVMLGLELMVVLLVIVFSLTLLVNLLRRD
jgi:ABC-type tungstate transport system substrate-binding protein